jgi:hypothetical protein
MTDLRNWKMLENGEEFKIKVIETGETATVFYFRYAEVYDENGELFDDTVLWFYAMSDLTGKTFIIDEFSVLRA